MTCAVVCSFLISASFAAEPLKLPSLASAATSVAVAQGRASIDLPANSAKTPLLVVVSSLATGGGSFPVRLSAQPIPRPPLPTLLAPRPTFRLPLVDLPPLPPIPSPTDRLPPATRTFHLMTQSGLATSASSYRAIPSQLRAVGRRVQVYVDVSDSASVDVETLRDLVTTFDDHVWPKVAERYGPATDIDRDGRFTILLTRWLSRLGDGQTRVDGFVRGADLDRRQPAPFGNQADMMYLNANLSAGPHLRTVLAHEYTHAVTFSRKVLAHEQSGPLDASTEEEGWLDEGLAHMVEDDLGFSRSNLDYRISAFLTQPERYRLVVEDYYTADLFRSHGNRGATYLFLRWCVDRFGPSLLDTLIRSPRRGVANLEAATGFPFAELFRRWTLALYCSGIDPAEADSGTYRSINLRGELDDWILAGPQVVSTRPGGSAQTWATEGTAAHFVLVESSPTQSTRIEVEASPEADLQVTILALPSGQARPELVVRPTTDPDGSVRVRARFRETSGASVRLGALAWERLVPVADRHAPGFRHDGLDMLGIASTFGTSLLPSQGALQSRPIPLRGVRPADGILVFKAVGIDPHGRRVAAWAVVDPSAQPPALAWDDERL